MWLEEQGCHDTVKNAWKAISADLPMSKVMMNVDTCKSQLRVWSKKSFGNVVNTLSKKRKNLKIAEESTTKGGSVEFFLQLKTEVAELLRVEEKCGSSEVMCIGWYRVTKTLAISIIVPHSNSVEIALLNSEILRGDWPLVKRRFRG